MVEGKADNNLISRTVIFIMTIGVVIASLFYFKHINREERQQVVFALESIAVQQERVARAVVKSCYDELSAYTYDYRQYEFDSPQQWKNMLMYHRSSPSPIFFALGVVTPEGKTFSSIENEVDFDRALFVEAARRERFTVQLLKDDSVSDEVVFAFGLAPYIGEDQPVVFGLCTGGALIKAVDSSAVESGGRVFLCSGEGKILYRKGELTDDEKDVWSDDMFDVFSHAKIEGNDFQRLTYEISSGISGAAYLNMNSRALYCRYCPLKPNGLTMVTVFPEQKLITHFKTSESGMWSAAFVISIFAGVATICIMVIKLSDKKVIQHSRERIRESESYAREQKKLLDFVLENSATQLWEYIVADQKVVIYENGEREILDDGANYYIDNNRIHPDDAGKFLSLYSRINNGEGYVSEELRVRERGTGEYSWIRMDAYVIFDENGKPERAMMVSNDISGQKTAEQRYENEVKLRKIADPSLVFMLRVNLASDMVEERICHNNMFSDLLELDTLTEVNKYITDRIVNEADRHKVKAELNSRRLLYLFNHGILKYEVEYRRKIEGDIVHWIRITANSMRSPTSDDIMCFVYIRDINSTKVLELTSRSSIMDDYEYVACLDMNSDMIYAVKLDNDFENSYRIEEERFSQRLIRLSAGELPMTREQMEMLSINGIKRNLSYRDTYSDFFEVKNLDGQVRRKKVHYSYLDRDRGLVLLNRSDVTDIYQGEQRKNAAKARGALLGSIGSQLKKPLEGIMSTLNAIRSDIGADMMLCMDKAMACAEHINGIIGDMICMADIDAERLKPDMNWVDILPIERDIDETAAFLTGQSGVKITTEYSQNQRSRIYTDKDIVKKIFMRVLSSAAVIPAVSCVRCAVRWEFANNGAAVMHAEIDTMSKKTDRMPESAAHQPDTKAVSGPDGGKMGLNMMIVKSLIELLDGSVDIESRQGEPPRIILNIAMGLDANAAKQDNVRGDDLSGKGDAPIQAGENQSR